MVRNGLALSAPNNAVDCTGENYGSTHVVHSASLFTYNWIQWHNDHETKQKPTIQLQIQNSSNPDHDNVNKRTTATNDDQHNAIENEFAGLGDQDANTKL